MILHASEIIDWLYQHDQVWKDFCHHFGIDDYLKELPEDEGNSALIPIEEDQELELYYNEEADVVEIV